MKHLQVISETQLIFNGKHYRCAIGSNGFTTTPKEGDKATPIGIYPLRECWFRKDRVSLTATELTQRAIQPTDGWCDAPEHPKYNQHVSLPFAASHEELWRTDHSYDIMIPLGFNDDPIIAGLGSAIFFHLAKPDYSPTLGCIAISLDDMLVLLPQLSNETNMIINPHV